jgi:hypothetical protein
MSENLPQTRQAAAIAGRSGRMKVTGKLKTALELMVWSGLTRADAAKEAELADSSLRAALRKPHVLSHYNAELSALRTSLRARNVHRLDNIADASKNDQARVNAVKALEQIAEQSEQTNGPQHQTPGVSIVIIQAPEPKSIDAPQMIIAPAPFLPAPGN